MKNDLVLQGRYSAVVLSVLTHVGVAILLIKSTNFSSTHVAKKTPAIKSYIYTPPAIKKTPAILLPKPEAVKTEKEQPKKKIVPIETAVVKEKKISEKTVQPSTLSELEKATVVKAKTELDKLLDEIKPPKKLLQQKNIKAKSISRSAYSQLAKLNETLEQRFVENEAFERYRARSASVLDGEPFPVPHSIQQLTPEQQKEKNTTKMSDDLAIIKGDDGLCYIEQDLTSVGIEGVKAISGFKCGQSKFDKNFKAHMNKVLKKLGK